MFSVLPWLFGAVGVLGIGGTIAAVILFPAVAIPMLQATIARLLACKICMYMIAVVILCSIAWLHGHHTAVVQCRAAELAAELRNRQIDLENAKQAAADESARASQIERDANDQHAKDTSYIAELQKNPACLLDDADIDGLRDSNRPGSAKPPSHSK